MRDNSPPDAIFDKDFGSSPKFAEIRNSILSIPFAVRLKPSSVSEPLSFHIFTTNLVFFIFKSESSASTFFSISFATFSLFLESSIDRIEASFLSLSIPAFISPISSFNFSIA